MNNQINIIVQNHAFTLNRQLLISQSENTQIKTSKDYTLPFPEWVTKQTYMLLQKYLKTKDVMFLKAYVNQNETIVKVLRTADYLGMIKFHDKFINQVLIPNINHHNCLSLLEQSHKKLKNIADSQTWYNLLNMSIIYLSTHAFQVFRLNPLKFKKLNEKIVTQVLQRVIRLERKNNFENKHMLYQLIMECKQTQIGQPNKLFQVLRANLNSKKIHSKIHAKLSWKLENIPELTEKNTKNFKYLDMNWFLKAHKIQQGLLVTLNLIPFQQNVNFSSNQSQYSQSSTEKSTKSFQITKAAQQRSQIEQMYKNDTFTKIGIFYSKVNWKFQQQGFQQQIKIHYILMNQHSAMDIILMDKKMQKIIGPQKVELTIFCNTQTIYTFLINYVFWNFDRVVFKGPNFCAQQLLILIKASKRVGNFSQALKITSDIIHFYPVYKGNLQISQGYDFSKMTKIEIQIYSSLFGKKLAPEPIFIKSQPSPFLQPPTPIYQNIRLSQDSNYFQKKTASPISITPINSINKRVNFSSSSSQLMSGPKTDSIFRTPSSVIQSKQKISSFNRTGSDRQNKFMINNDSLANSRGDSRNSKRKIFTKTGSGQKLSKQDSLIEQMLKVTDLSRYLYPDPARNPQFDRMSAILKI